MTESWIALAGLVVYLGVGLAVAAVVAAERGGDLPLKVVAYATVVGWPFVLLAAALQGAWWALLRLRPDDHRTRRRA